MKLRYVVCEEALELRLDVRVLPRIEHLLSFYERFLWNFVNSLTFGLQLE